MVQKNIKELKILPYNREILIVIGPFSQMILIINVCLPTQTPTWLWHHKNFKITDPLVFHSSFTSTSICIN